VGRYAYCAHAWWLAEFEKRDPVDLGVLEDGTKAHERHGWRVSMARVLYRAALFLLVVAAMVVLVWGLFAIAVSGGSGIG
jgi:hypothetical protein